MRDYIKLIRVKHYIKNLLVFLPMFFGGVIFDGTRLLNAFLGFICFCLTSSAIYIFNDYRDIEKDRKHPTKKERPLASGRIKPQNALILMGVLIAVTVLLSIVIGDWRADAALALYFALNIAYSMGLKKKPIVDIVILASGFVIRLFYGGFITDVVISQWLFLVVCTGSLYMGLGKRRSELMRQSAGGETREVLKYYNKGFLDKNMYVCVALADVFYALWALEMNGGRMIWTVPMFIILLLYYSLVAEGDSDGDPVEVILHDKVLVGFITIYAVVVTALLYI